MATTSVPYPFLFAYIITSYFKKLCENNADAEFTKQKPTISYSYLRELVLEFEQAKSAKDIANTSARIRNSLMSLARNGTILQSQPEFVKSTQISLANIKLNTQYLETFHSDYQSEMEKLNTFLNDKFSDVDKLPRPTRVTKITPSSKTSSTAITPVSTSVTVSQTQTTTQKATVQVTSLAVLYESMRLAQQALTHYQVYYYNAFSKLPIAISPNILSFFAQHIKNLHIAATNTYDYLHNKLYGTYHRTFFRTPASTSTEQDFLPFIEITKDESILDNSPECKALYMHLQKARKSMDDLLQKILEIYSNNKELEQKEKYYFLQETDRLLSQIQTMLATIQNYNAAWAQPIIPIIYPYPIAVRYDDKENYYDPAMQEPPTKIQKISETPGHTATQNSMPVNRNENVVPEVSESNDEEDVARALVGMKRTFGSR